MVAEFKQHMRRHLALCVARERGEESEEAVTRSQVFLTEYATNELREYHEAHFQQINQLMGFLVQSKNLAKIVCSTETVETPQYKWLLENYLKPLQEEEEEWTALEERFVAVY